MGEKFDIYDEQGRWIGVADRVEVHAKGYWHRTFHCWLVRPGAGGAKIVFQKRHADKDTNPGCYDITVAGHLAAGESMRDAVREMEEEIGWSAPFEELTPYGEVREETEGGDAERSYVDREVSRVFGCVTTAPLTGFRLQPDEVAGLYEADADELIALMSGAVRSVCAAGVERRADGALTPVVADVTAAAFVPRDPAYYINVFRFLRRLASGDGTDAASAGPETSA